MSTNDIYSLNPALQGARQAIQDAIANMTIELPELPEPEVEPDEEDWLFDSSRGYFEQLAVYKARKSGEVKQVG